jgi:hypothetical protein
MKTKPAICCVCGKDLKARVPVDAENVRCFACTEARFSRAGEHLHRRAKELGWKDDGEGAYEFVTRVHYEGGLKEGKS